MGQASLPINIFNAGDARDDQGDTQLPVYSPATILGKRKTFLPLLINAFAKILLHVSIPISLMHIGKNKTPKLSTRNRYLVFGE